MVDWIGAGSAACECVGTGEKIDRVGKFLFKIKLYHAFQTFVDIVDGHGFGTVFGLVALTDTRSICIIHFFLPLLLLDQR